MTDALNALAEAAGVAPRWLDVHGTWHDVAPETLRTVLEALGLPGSTEAQIRDSHAALVRREATLPPLVTAVVGKAVELPVGGRWQLRLEQGGTLEGHGAPGPVGQPGYHHLTVGDAETTLAVAPARGFTVQDAAPGSRPWALAVQLYALRRAGDGGLGDFRALQDLVGPAARAGAAAIAISPAHAQFSADIHRFSPYSPSSRIQSNVLHAGLALPPGEAAPLEALPLVDWPAAARLRLDALRAAYAAQTPTDREALARYRAEEGSALETHAVFEALHAAQFAEGRWHWRTWPAGLQHPDNPEVRAFAEENAGAVDLHAFMQFRADRSLAEAQRAARAAGMPIGLIADLAVGADSGGSQCWARQDETLLGMSIGAPPDLLATEGQSWGLAAFSPRGLRDNGYRAFLEMLRHAMRHAGGVRIDHALGLQRLWVVPDGASARDGAYIAFPLDDMLRLIALESSRHQAVVLGEDLGTIPDGFQERLADSGTLGMRVLWFEKKHGLFTDPRGWTREAAAMTSTHDLATVAGWWRGRDLEWRGALGLSGGSERHAREEAERVADRAALWAAFTLRGAASGPMPPPSDPGPALDAATRHLAGAACDLVILPIEDALGLVEQPNLPGTMDDQHPNWRRRLPGPAATLLDPPDVAERLAALTRGRTA